MIKSASKYTLNLWSLSPDLDASQSGHSSIEKDSYWPEHVHSSDPSAINLIFYTYFLHLRVPCSFTTLICLKLLAFGKDHCLFMTSIQMNWWWPSTSRQKVKVDVVHSEALSLTIVYDAHSFSTFYSENSKCSLSRWRQSECHTTQLLCQCKLWNIRERNRDRGPATETVLCSTMFGDLQKDNHDQSSGTIYPCKRHPHPMLGSHDVWG